MPRLSFRTEGRELFAHVLRPGRTIVGRADSCDVALPGEAVSRIHVLIDGRGAAWTATNRSKNGTALNGRPLERAELCHGDRLTIGPYEVAFATDEPVRHATTEQVVASRVHEELLAVGGDAITSCRAELVFSRGPRAGETYDVQRTPTTIGGMGADVVIDDALPRDAVRIRVVRGRVLVEPSRTAVFLAGQRVRELTPALIGEEIRVGDHAFAVNVATTADVAEERELFGDMIGASVVMRKLFGTLARIAAHDDAVLLTGESGTGKEVAAKSLHDCGSRHAGPFVAVNCAAVTDSLFESELFGHEKGAFTGAVSRQDGAFQQAAGGTLFLDEVGELRADLQAKLLRALESGEVRRVGATAPEYPDVRIVAATNRDLAAMVRAGAFRQDLYFRLAVLTVRLPPLRERPTDVVPLAKALLHRIEPAAILTPDALRALEAYDWPGNVRELRNVLTRAFVMGGPVVSREALTMTPGAFEPAPISLVAAEDTERGVIAEALRRSGGNRTRAARDLGIPRSSLLYRLQRLGIDGA